MAQWSASRATAISIDVGGEGNIRLPSPIAMGISLPRTFVLVKDVLRWGSRASAALYPSLSVVEDCHVSGCHLGRGGVWRCRSSRSAPQCAPDTVGDCLGRATLRLAARCCRRPRHLEGHLSL